MENQESLLIQCPLATAPLQNFINLLPQWTSETPHRVFYGHSFPASPFFFLLLYFKLSSPRQLIPLLQWWGAHQLMPELSTCFLFFYVEHSFLPHRNSTCQNDKSFPFFTFIFTDDGGGSASLNNICKITELLRKTSQSSKAVFLSKKREICFECSQRR